LCEFYVAPDLGYQTVTFDVAAYWDAYYQDEPFYNDQYRVTEARGGLAAIASEGAMGAHRYGL